LQLQVVCIRLALGLITETKNLAKHINKYQKKKRNKPLKEERARSGSQFLGVNYPDEEGIGGLEQDFLIKRGSESNLRREEK
jgi:hypothetical protein